MASDVKLDGDKVIVEGQNITANVCDFILDAPGRRRTDISTSAVRRALVHWDDGLYINLQKDYPNGVTIEGDVKIPNKLIAQGNVELNGEVKIPNKLVVTGDVELQKLGATEIDSTSIQSTSVKLINDFTSTTPGPKVPFIQRVTIKDGAIIISTEIKGKPRTLEEHNLGSEVNNLGSEVQNLKQRIDDLESKLKAITH